MPVVMLACGSAVETSVDLSDASTQELQERIEEEHENWIDDTVFLPSRL